jgi:hypothetical protein
MMTSKILRRLVGTLTCVAAVVAGWDAEAGHRHRRRACCEPVCCEPVCVTSCAAPCETVCETACAPRCVRYYDSCSCCWRTTWSYSVVSRPAACCETMVIAATSAASADTAQTASVMKTQPISTSAAAQAK